MRLCSAVSYGTACIIMHRYGDSPPEEVKELSATVLVASVTGFLFGGMIGARHAGDKYIALNHNTKYASAMQAQVCATINDNMSATLPSHEAVECMGIVLPNDKRVIKMQLAFICNLYI